MEVDDEWAEAEKAIAGFDQYSGMRPTVRAMLRLLVAARRDPTISNAHPTVHSISLGLSYRGPRRLSVSWQQDAEYKVCFVDPPLEFSEPVAADEENVLRVIREHLARLEIDAPNASTSR